MEKGRGVETGRGVEIGERRGEDGEVEMGWRWQGNTVGVEMGRGQGRIEGMG